MKRLFLIVVSLLMVLGSAQGLADGAKPVPAPTPIAVASPTPKPVAHVKVTIDPDRLVRIEDEIGSELSDAFITDINNLDAQDQKKPIYIIISSNGGSLDDGFRMENNMDALRAPTVCIVDNTAKSMASAIFLHCGKRYMVPHSDLMFHWGSLSVSGPRIEAQRAMEHALKEFDEFDQDNANHLKMSLAAYRAKIDHDWWLTADEAVRAGAADAVVDDFRAPSKTKAILGLPLPPLLPW